MKKAFEMFLYLSLFGMMISGCATSVTMEVEKAPPVDLKAYSAIGVMDTYVESGKSGPTIYNETNPEFTQGIDFAAPHLAAIIEFYYEKQKMNSRDIEYSNMVIELMMKNFKKSSSQNFIESKRFIPKNSSDSMSNLTLEILAKDTEIKAFLFPYIVYNSNLAYKHTLSGSFSSGYSFNDSITGKLNIYFGYKIYDIEGKLISEKAFESTQEISVANVSGSGWEEQLFSSMMPSLVNQMTYYLVPKKIKVSYALVGDKTKNPLMQEAESLVKLKQYAQAKDLYLQIFNETKNPAAAINAGIMFRALDDLAGGVAFLKAAVLILDTKELQKELEKMEADLVERDKFL